MNNKIKDLYFRLTGPIKRLKLKSTDFSIISNNCFAGIIYRDNAIPYMTPTCGLFFMAEEYIKFIYNLDYYLSIDEIKEIKINDSKYSDYLRKIGYEGIIGKIDDLEVCFLHYNSIEEASEKWNRRKKRINKDKLIFKFSDQNECTYELLKKFNNFNAKNKICFTSKKYSDLDTIQIKKYENEDYVLEDTKINGYKEYLDIYKYLNNI